MNEGHQSEKIGFFGRCVKHYNEAWDENHELLHRRFSEGKYLSSLISPEVWRSEAKVYLAPMTIPISEARKSLRALFGKSE